MPKTLRRILDKLKRLSMMFVALLVAAVAVSAAPLTLATDCAGANNLNSYQCEGANALLHVLPPTAKMTITQADGLGVNGPGLLEDSGEIDWTEWFEVKFDTPMFVSEVYLTNLFRESCFLCGAYNEQGYVRINDTVTIQFGADPTKTAANSNGERTVAINMPVEEMTFGSNFRLLGDNNYSVKGWEANAVPEPGTYFMLGAGLLAFALGRKRFKSNAS